LLMSITCARSIVSHLAMDPSVSLVRKLCQHKQIVSAERPRRLPVAGLVPVRPCECNGVPGARLRFLSPDGGLQTTVADRLRWTLFRRFLRCRAAARPILRNHVDLSFVKP